MELTGFKATYDRTEKAAKPSFNDPGRLAVHGRWCEREDEGDC